MHRHDVAGLVADPDHLTNFLGVRIAPKFFPGLLDGRAGQIEPIPIPANWHADIAEWAAALRAVDLAGSEFRVVELGCGWGCWLNNTGAAARRLGKHVTLIGIEGDAEHLAFAHESLATNGFGKDDYVLIHGIAAPRRGTALFPIVTHAGSTWGSAPVFDASPEDVAKAEKAGTFAKLDMLPLSDISQGNQIDLLHIDIQGGEADFLSENIADINALVKYIVIGTHSRAIEGRIIPLMLTHGWVLEIERPCIFDVGANGLTIRVDGVQGWRKP